MATSVDLGRVVGPVGKSLSGLCYNNADENPKIINLNISEEDYTEDTLAPGTVVFVHFLDKTMVTSNISLEFRTDNNKTVATRTLHLRYPVQLDSQNTDGLWSLEALHTSTSTNFRMGTDRYPWRAGQVVPIYILNSTSAFIQYEDIIGDEPIIGDSGGGSATNRTQIILEAPIALRDGALCKVWFTNGLTNVSASSDGVVSYGDKEALVRFSTEGPMVLPIVTQGVTDETTLTGEPVDMLNGNGWGPNSWVTFRLSFNNKLGYHFLLIGVESSWNPVLTNNGLLLGQNTLVGYENYDSLHEVLVLGGLNTYQWRDMIVGHDNKDTVSAEAYSIFGLPHNFIVGRDNYCTDTYRSIIIGERATVVSPKGTSRTSGNNVCITPYAGEISGESSIVIGRGIAASGAVVIGTSEQLRNATLTTQAANGAIAIGSVADLPSETTRTTGVQAKGELSIAIGGGYENTLAASSNEKGAVSIGSGSMSLKQGDIALGYQATAGTIGLGKIAIGSGIDAAESNGGPGALGTGSIAIGCNISATDTTLAETSGCIAIGQGSHAKGTGAIVIGRNTSSLTSSNTSAPGASGAVVIGDKADVSAEGAIAIGANARATARAAIALGKATLATESDTVSVGNADRNIYSRVVNVAAPVNEHDAATKAYVDTAIQNVNKVPLLLGYCRSKNVVFVSNKALIYDLVYNSTNIGHTADSDVLALPQGVYLVEFAGVFRRLSSSDSTWSVMDAISPLFELKVLPDSTLKAVNIANKPKISLPMSVSDSISVGISGIVEVTSSESPAQLRIFINENLVDSTVSYACTCLHNTLKITQLA